MGPDNIEAGSTLPVDPEPIGNPAETAQPSVATPPPVVAVMVTHNPGPWLEESLQGLAAQDYAQLSILVVDTASDEDPTARVAALLPDAFVRRLDSNPGFGAAANEALRLVEGAAFFCFLHDDVAVEPSTIRLLVEESYRSNAGVVGPKLVDWDDPRRLLQVGMGVDKAGVYSPYLERGELDQEQHDAVRDVFVVPGGCVLVRTDLFRALGGFEPSIDFHGDDLDLCWRAHVAGARVLVNPSARARHREALDSRQPGDRRRLLGQHRLFTVLTCYGPIHLVRVLPQVVVLNVVELLYALVIGRFRVAGDVVSAWSWNLRRLNAIRRRRKALNRLRQVPDNEVRHLQVRGSARLSAFVRGQVGDGGEDRISTAAAVGRDFVGRLRQGPRRTAVFAWIVVAAFLVLGSRQLLTNGVPAIGELSRIGDAPLIREYFSGWRSAGLGSSAPAPTALALIGLGNIVVLGHPALLHTLLVLGPLAAGAIGAWRLTRPIGSGRARVVTLVTYVAVPLPYNALAQGRWAGLVLYGAAPWMLSRLARASRLAPYGDRGGAAGPGLSRRSWLAQIIGLGLVTALASAVVPFALALLVGLAAGILVASLLVGGFVGAIRGLLIAAGAAAVAFALHLPWSADLIGKHSSWSAVGAVQPAGAGSADLGALLRFQSGPTGAAPLGWAILVAAALALLIGREWRLAWAVRAWVIAAGSFALAWSADRGWIHVGLPVAEVLLAPAAVSLALAAGLGVAAFEADLRGFRFGWRQLASFVGLAAVVVATLPALGLAADGRWNIPEGDFAHTLSFMQSKQADGDFRVLWVGDPAVLPLTGWRLTDGLAYALSDNGVPDIRNDWAGTPTTATRTVADVLAVAGAGRTSRLGRLLAPMGVRYVVVPSRIAPAPDGTPVIAAPETFTNMLATQLDLERLDVDDALTVYENAAWIPVHALLGAPAAALADSANGPSAELDPNGTRAALPQELGPEHFRGAVPGSSSLYVAEGPSPRWHVSVNGADATRQVAFGVGNLFQITSPGTASLSYATPRGRTYAILAQALGWLIAVLWVQQAAGRANAPKRAARRRRRSARRKKRRDRRRHARFVSPADDLIWADRVPADVPAGPPSDGEGE